MRPHVIEFLAAYHDGELTSNRRQQVEKHIQDCSTCRAELEALAELSSFLKADAIPRLTSPQQFAAQVQLRLPRESRSQIRHKEGRLPQWMLGIPLALIISWAFLQAVLWVTSFILAADPILGARAAFFKSWLPAAGWLRTSADLLLFNALLLIGTAILFSAWMALWLAWKKNESLESSSVRL